MAYTVVDRFLKYVTIDTQSDATSTNCPSTQKQFDLSNLLVDELCQMGITDAHVDEHGYVYATIKSNTNKIVPTLCFCSHVDTTADCSGTNVKPILHKQYNGQDIVLPLDPTQIISPKQHAYLLQHVGKDIITASGDTLLGADDKSGIAIIMDLAYQLTQNKNIPHGDIKILFTPDEEIGRGADKVDIAKLNAQYAYTLDGGAVATYEDETFSANYVCIEIIGASFHPGDAKGKLINAVKIASDIIAALPKDSWSPETTEKREGFVHPLKINGTAEKATIEFIIRSFETPMLAEYQHKLKAIAQDVLAQYPKASMNFTVTEQYRNMKEIIDQHPAIISNLLKAYQACGLTPINEPIRGGTDGSKLSFMGLPCPNIFTGMQAIHGKHEWVGVEDMKKAVDVLVALVQQWEQNA